MAVTLPLARLLVVGGMVIAVAACAGPEEAEAPQPPGQEETRPPEAPRPEEEAEGMDDTEGAPAPAADQDHLDEGDDGTTTSLELGEAVTVRLDGERTWSLVDVEGDAVDLAPVDYFADPGFTEWTVIGTTAGTAVARFDGQPACGDEAACPPTTVALRFAVG